MKLTARFIKIRSTLAALVAVLCMVPGIAFAELTVVAGSVQHTTTSYTANYQATSAPSHPTTLYAWVGDASDTSYPGWTRNLLLANMTASTPMPASFAAEFNYAQLGLVSGKTYAYAIADRSVVSGAVFYQPADHCFTVTSGSVACPGGAQPNQQQGAFSVTLAAGAETAGQGGLYDQQFDITPDNPLAMAQQVEVRVFAAANPANPAKTIVVTLPAGSFTTSPTVEGLAAGSYTAAVYSGGAKISLIVSVTVTAIAAQNQQSQNQQQNQNTQNNPSQNQPTITGQTQNNSVGGVMVNFYPNLQTIGATSATITGTVSVAIPMDVNLSALSGLANGTLGNIQSVLSVAQMQPGQTQNFVMNFTGLAPGTAYQFAIKNNITNTVSSALQFTTTGGSVPGGVITYTGGLFPYTPNQNITDGSQPIPGVTDTISGVGIVPKCGRSQNEEGTIPRGELAMCGFDDFLQLIANIITFSIIILGPIAAIAILYAGFMIIVTSWSKDPTEEIMQKRRHYMNLLLRIGIGVAIILSAWIIVATILRELGVKPAYILLDIFN